MEKWEISGNLNTECGIKNYSEFQNTITKVLNEFCKVFPPELIHRYPLLIDNSTKGSGHTPIITPILGRYLIIKLNVEDGLPTSQTAFQFAHEMMHLIFYSIFGINKERAGSEEESICTAASLCIIKSLVPKELDVFVDYVSRLEYEGYRNGVIIAEQCNHSLEKIREIAIFKTLIVE
jgi:hypothetical protein